MSGIQFGSFPPAAAAAITNSLAETLITKYSDPFAFAEEEKIKIADGSDGTQVWEVKATLDSKDFALKTIPDEKRAMTEFAAYRRLEDQNIIRCYSCTKVDNGYQLLFERGECTLLELIKVCNGDLPTHENPNREKFLTWAKQNVTLWEDFYRPAGDKLDRPDRTPSTTLVSLLRDIVKGVVYLHKMDVAHGRLNPNNILIFKNRDNSLRAKLSHFGCSWSGSPGWQAPEQVKGEQGNMNSDKYVLGMILCYAIIGNHLLGSFTSFDHEGEMSSRDVFLFKESVNGGRLLHCDLETKLLPDVISLVQELMSPTPTNRLSLKLLELEHPIFWGTSKRGRLISQKHSLLKQSKSSHVRTYLNKCKVIVNNRSWLKQVDQKLLEKYKDNIKKQQNQEAVDPSSVVGPAGAVRSIKEENQGAVGPVHQGAKSSVVGPVHQGAKSSVVGPVHQGAKSSVAISSSVVSLIWFMRNVTEHFEDYTDEFEGVKATNVCKAWDYFFAQFPHLVIECYNYVKSNLLDDEQFEELLLPLQR